MLTITPIITVNYYYSPSLVRRGALEELEDELAARGLLLALEQRRLLLIYTYMYTYIYIYIYICNTKHN